MPLKAQFGQKLARDVMYYHNRIIQRFEKNGYSRQSCRLPDSPIRGVVFQIRISPRIRSQNQNSSKCSVRDLGQSDLCRQTDRQTDRQADRRTDRQTERQTDRQKDKQKDRCRCYIHPHMVLNVHYSILGGGPQRRLRSKI